MVWRTMTVAVLAALSLPAAAAAGGHHKHRHHRPASTKTIIAPPAPINTNLDPIPIAEERAVAYWHATPCSGSPIAVGFAIETPQFRAEEAAAYGLEIDYSWSSWDSPAGANTKTAPPATYTDCAITFNAEDWPTCTTTPTAAHCTYSDSWKVIDEYWPTFCEAFIHEWGNLLGIPEEGPSGTSVMSQTGPTPPLTVCGK